MGYYGSNKKVWEFLIISPEDKEVYTESQTTAHRPTLPQPQSWWRRWHSWLVRLAGSGLLLHLQIVWKWSCFSFGESNKLLTINYNTFTINSLPFHSVLLQLSLQKIIVWNNEHYGLTSPSPLWRCLTDLGPVKIFPDWFRIQ